MSRRRAAVKRQILPDAKYRSVIVAKFINRVMMQGKKSIAESIIYNALEICGTKLNLGSESEPKLEFFLTALKNTKPSLEVRSKRIGGATYQVPVDVKEHRALALAMKWLISISRARPEQTMDTRLAAELMEAYNNRGGAVKKKEDTHKMADANKAFAHYKIA